MRQGQGGSNSYLKNWIKNNYILKIILYIIIIFSAFGTFFFIIDKRLGGDTIIIYNKFNYIISKILNSIPIYNNYTQYFKRYYLYENYEYTINQGLLNSNSLNNYFIDYWGKTFFEFLPFLLSSIFFMPLSSHIKNYYINYNDQIGYRNMIPEKDPEQSLIDIIETEGTVGEDKEHFNPKEIEKMKDLYVKNNFYKKRYSSKEHQFNSDVPGLLKLYEEKLMINMKRYLYEESNYFINPETKKSTNKELYFPSLGKEVTFEELYAYYRYTMLFMFAKQCKNFSMHSYTINLDVPREIKKMCKWMVGRNAPGIVFVPDDPNVPIMQRKMKPAKLYYRIYKVKFYIGMDVEYMKKFIKMMDENK